MKIYLSWGGEPSLKAKVTMFLLFLLFFVFLVCLFFALITFEIESIGLNNKWRIPASLHVSESGFWNPGKICL